MHPFPKGYPSWRLHILLALVCGGSCLFFFNGFFGFLMVAAGILWGWLTIGEKVEAAYRQREEDALRSLFESGMEFIGKHIDHIINKAGEPTSFGYGDHGNSGAQWKIGGVFAAARFQSDICVQVEVRPDFSQLSDEELLAQFGSGNLSYTAEGIAADEIQVRGLQFPVRHLTNMDKNCALIDLSESERTKIGKEDFSLQSYPQKVFSAIWTAESEIHNGGFAQYFQNASNETAAFVVEAFKAIGAPRTADICLRAVVVAFPDGLPFTSDAISVAAANFADDITEQLELLDTEFFQYPHNLTDLLFTFVSQHPEEFGSLPERDATARPSQTAGKKY